MSNEAIYPVPANFADAHITPEKYQEMYRSRSMTQTRSGVVRHRSFSPGTSHGTPFARVTYRRARTLV